METEAMVVTPLEILKALVDLQEIDVRILELENDSRQIPDRLKEIDSIVGSKKKELNDELNRLDEAEMARRLAESDLKAEKEKIKKWESRLNEIKSNRDYQALSREIEACRKANLGIEDEILRKMQDIEDLKTSSGQKKEELAEKEAELSKERQALEEKLASINASIAGEEKGRNEAKERVESRWYEQYRTISKRREGIALVTVLDEHCQGCHMGIPPQLYNVILKGAQIETCPYCSRILYYEPALVDKNISEAASGQE
jgi:uncharacterized protein